MGNFYPLPNLQFLTDRLQLEFEWLRHGELQPCQRGFGSDQRFGLPVVVTYTRTVTFFFFNFSESRPGQTHGPICTHDSSKYAAWRKEVPSEWNFVFVFTFWGSFCPKTAKNSFGIGISQLNSKTVLIQWWDLHALDNRQRCENLIGCQLRNVPTTIGLLLWRHIIQAQDHAYISAVLMLHQKSIPVFLNSTITFEPLGRFSSNLKQGLPGVTRTTGNSI